MSSRRNEIECNDDDHDNDLLRLPVNRLHVLRKVECFGAWWLSSVDLIHRHSFLHHRLGFEYINTHELKCTISNDEKSREMYLYFMQEK
jgi:hypothetical protein